MSTFSAMDEVEKSRWRELTKGHTIMIMADVFKILFLILGTLVTIVSYWLLFEALFSQTVERARRQYETRRLRTALVGLGISAPLFIAGLALLSGHAAVKLAGVVVLSTLILVGLLGSTGLVRHIGLQLNSTTDATHAWRRVLRGGIVLSITFVLPIVGWFFVLPLTLASGVGAVVLSWRANRNGVATGAA